MEKQPLSVRGAFPKSSRASSREGPTYRSIGDESDVSSPPKGDAGRADKPTSATVTLAPAGQDGGYLQVGDEGVRQNSGDTDYLKIGDDVRQNSGDSVASNQYLQIGDESAPADLLGLSVPASQGTLLLARAFTAGRARTLMLDCGASLAECCELQYVAAQTRPSPSSL